MASIVEIQDGHIIFNTVRAGLSETFQKNIPKATKETLKEIGMLLRPEDVTNNLWNEWIEGLLNVIGLEMVEASSIENELEPKINKSMPFGDLIRHYAVQPARGRDFRVTPNLDWSNPYYVYNPTVLVEYHRKNFRMQWYNSTFWDLASRAFDTASGMNTLITYIIQSLYEGRNNDVYQAQKEILNTYMHNADWPLKPYQTIEVPQIVDDVTARATILAVKNILTAWRRTSGDFNLEGFIKQVRGGNVDVFIRQELLNYLEVETYYGAFNRGDLALSPGTGGTAQPDFYILDNFGGIMAQAEPAGGGDPVNIYPVYSTREVDFGMVIGWSYTEGGAAVENLVPTSWVDPNQDVLMIIAEKSLMLGARARMDFNTTRNNTGRYDTHVLYEELALGYNGFANAAIIKMEPAATVTENSLAASIQQYTQSYDVSALPRKPESEETTKTMSNSQKSKLAQDLSKGKDI